MWWEKEKKARPIEPLFTEPRPLPPATLRPEIPIPEITPRATAMNTANQTQTLLGRSMVLHGELAGKEDLLIEGQFEGTISLPQHCLTVGPNGQVKADIHARQVIVQGGVTGDITAAEKIEIRRTGHVVGGLVAAGIAIEDGAYFKGSIEIIREQDQVSRETSATPAAFAATE